MSDRLFVELAKRFIKEHDEAGRVTPFEMDERMCIVLFAQWLDDRQSELELELN